MGRRSDLQGALAAVPLFSSCSQHERRLVARHMLVVEVPAGTDLTVEGDAGDAFYVVLEGKGSVRRGGHEVDVLGPGDHFGELALLDPAPRDATVSAVTSLVVGVLGTRVFRAVVRDVPSMNEKLLRELARRLRAKDVASV